jgi:LuxR family transcriptional regulator, quorum-sensing system regulator RaiR
MTNDGPLGVVDADTCSLKAPSVLTLTPLAECNARLVNLLWKAVEALNRSGEQEWDLQITFAQQQLSGVLAEIGVRFFSYHVIKDSGICTVPDPLAKMITTYPDRWTRSYVERDYQRDDPVLAMALETQLPFEWTQAWRPGKLTLHQSQFFADAWDAGLAGSVTVPIHGPHTLAAMNVTPFDYAGDTLRQYSYLLYLLAHFLHHKVRRPLAEVALRMSSRRRSVLSRRETEVLELAAKGLSTDQMSAELCISRRSVEFHVEGAKQKLHVSNRTHAVAKGIMLGLLSVD